MKVFGKIRHPRSPKEYAAYLKRRIKHLNMVIKRLEGVIYRNCVVVENVSDDTDAQVILEIVARKNKKRSGDRT